MRLHDGFTRSALYLYRGGDLLGTAFLVAPPDAIDGEAYVVTAHHLVAGQTDLRLRVNTTDGGVEWLPVDDDAWWEPDDGSADVALARWRDDESNVYRVAVIPWDVLADDAFLAGSDVGPGDEVAFVGLFQGLPGREQNHPIVRFGQIARMAEELVPQRWPGNTVRQMEAMLVEARSWGGHSGSPAFVLFEATRHPGVLSLPTYPLRPRSVFALLGLVSGHWELPADVQRKNQPVAGIEPEDEVFVNAGIALVTPSQKIIDLLLREDIVADRERRRAIVAQRNGAHSD